MCSPARAEPTSGLAQRDATEMTKENVFDVLMYLFENYMDEGPEFQPDQGALTHELSLAGFHKGEISKAFLWLEGLSDQRDRPERKPVANSQSLRQFGDAELVRLNAECRGFLLFMEQCGVLDATTREIVIDRAMALDLEELALEQLKWIILMVLFNQPGHEHAYALLEDLVFDEMQGHLH